MQNNQLQAQQSSSNHVVNQAAILSANFAHQPQTSSNNSYLYSYSWIVDFGETDHIVCSLSLFSHFTPVINTHVRLPNENSALVTIKVLWNWILTWFFMTSYVYHFSSSIWYLLVNSLSVYHAPLCFIPILALYKILAYGRQLI